MKNLLKVLLIAIVVVLAIINVRSILSPIEFEAVRVQRDSAVIARLIDIKNAEVEYKGQYGEYTNNFDTLINFLKNYKLPVVKKAYELNDRQLEKVAEIEKNKRRVREISISPDEADQIFLGILRNAEKKNDWKVIDELNALNAEGGDIRNFRRDTTWVSLIDTLYHNPNFPIDSLPYIPYGDGEKFTLLTDSISKAGGGYTQLFEARADFSQYLTGINDQEYDNYILGVKKKVTQVRREPVLNAAGEPMYDENDEEIVKIIPCRRVGSVKEANNNAGNWEW